MADPDAPDKEAKPKKTRKNRPHIRFPGWNKHQHETRVLAQKAKEHDQIITALFGDHRL